MSVTKTVIVSGASGFLGKELVTQLIGKEQYNVIALTSNENALKLKKNDQSKFKMYSIKSFLNSKESFSENDIFINCAFPRSSEPEKLANGIQFTEEIIGEMIKKGIGSIINISSQSVYSQKMKSTTNEETQVIPESFYGMTKYATERIVASLCEVSNINYTNIRLASLTGNELEVRMTNRFVKNAINNLPITVNGGNQRISYLDVTDAADALVKMLQFNPSDWKEIYNLGSHYFFTVLELAETVKKKAAELLGKEVEIEVKEGNSDFNNLIHSEKFYTDFNWTPDYDMPSMIESLFEYYENKLLGG